MVKITEELVRKKSEHNEGIIGTLEELSLHQEDVEKIENLNNWCKHLEILYLQSNVIPKIENLNKLKELKYLNLAINNIEVIENLKGCESLEKLDLTLNFIGDLESVASLKDNIHLKSLYLTGNPCCDFEGYREYVIATLPQIKSLDSKEITRSERIKALQVFEEVEKKVKMCEEKYSQFRADQIKRYYLKNTTNLTDDEFWQTKSENCPESRLEISKRQSKLKKHNSIEEKPIKNIRLFSKEGRPLNLNQAKLNFTFNDENPEKYVLDIEVYKFLDTSLIDVDLQPIYVKITIKGKIFQIVFPEEVFVEKSKAQRSQTTGHLVLNLPKVNYKPRRTIDTHDKDLKEQINKRKENKGPKIEYLEVEEKDDMDFSKIMENKDKVQKIEDNPEVPPLEYF